VRWARDGVFQAFSAFREKHCAIQILCWSSEKWPEEVGEHRSHEPIFGLLVGVASDLLNENLSSNSALLATR
jgi:hypothetical protein